MQKRGCEETAVVRRGDKQSSCPVNKAIRAMCAYRSPSHSREKKDLFAFLQNRCFNDIIKRVDF